MKIMLLERKPIAAFVESCFSNRRVTSIISTWNIEVQELRDLVVGHLSEMGIYYVEPNNGELLLNNVILYLKNSPHIKQRIRAIEADLIRRQQSRHA